MAEQVPLKARAENGDAEAQYALADMHWPEAREGEVVRGDLEEAKKWLRMAAEQGHLKAQLRLAALIGEVDVGETLKWLQRAAEQGSPEAAMGRCYYLMLYIGDEAEGVACYRQAITAGQPHRGDALGIQAPVYRDFVWGKKVIPPTERIPRERSLARAGDPGAQYRLGTLFANGAGVQLDFVQAYGWFAVAARPGQELAITTSWKHPVIEDWGTPARAVRLLDQVMDSGELGMARSLATDYLNRFGGSVALGARLYCFAERCASVAVAVVIVLPLLILRGLWGSRRPPNNEP